MLEDAIKKWKIDKADRIPKESRERLVNDWVIFEGRVWKYKRSSNYPKLYQYFIKTITTWKRVWKILEKKGLKLISEGKCVKFKRNWKTVQKGTKKLETRNRKERILRRTVRRLSITVKYFANKKIEIPIRSERVIDVIEVVFLGS